jgi:hypothetical protein
MANPFNIKDRVKTTNGARSNGRVYLIACALATAAGGKTCDPKTCTDATKDYVWVMWSGMQKAYSYHYTELERDVSPTETVDIKDDYIEKAKQAIKDMVKPKPVEPELGKDFWTAYNGFSKVKYDRNGRPFVKEIKQDESPPLKTEEVDFEKYVGRVRSKTYRKDT